MTAQNGKLLSRKETKGVVSARKKKEKLRKKDLIYQGSPLERGVLVVKRVIRRVNARMQRVRLTG